MSPKHPLGQVKDVHLSFSHPLVNAHFRFAIFLLDILGEMNTIFQVEYGFVHNFMEYLDSVRQFLRRELWKIENGELNRFPYVDESGEENRPQFESTLKHLILNF